MAAPASTFSVPLVGGGWLSSRRRPDVPLSLRRQLRDMQRGAKILGLPLSVNARHRSFLSPVPTHSPFYPWGINHFKDAERRLLTPAPVVLRLCRTCLWSRTYPHKMTPSIYSSLPWKSPARDMSVSHPQHHPWIDASHPRKEHETTSHIFSNL